MKGSFFFKMALKNIRANKQLYLPYFISAALTVSMFSQMLSLLDNDFVQSRGDSLALLFGFGAVVIGLFSFVFLLYANSFLIKRRKKEIGLYGILGLEKKHVARILFLETILVGAGSILLGLVAGILFGRLFFLLLNYLLKLPEVMDYSLWWGGLGIAAAVFIAIFFFAYLYNLSQVTFSNPINLLKGEKGGEREPKSNLFLFLLGVLLVGSGYWISVTISDPVAAMIQFFLAVLLVILGTYLLFTAGSIFILKAMKKNKKLYYRPKAFISISGMLYRMKQNAIGLANISVLSCMVIIALATTLTIYVGSEETLLARYPGENNVTVYTNEEETIESVQGDMANLIGRVEEQTAAQGLELKDAASYTYVSLFGDLEGNAFHLRGAQGLDIPATMVMLSLSDFNRVEQKNLVLEEDQLFFHMPEDFEEDTLAISGVAFDVLPLEDKLSVLPYGDNEAFGDAFFVVMPNVERMNDVLAPSRYGDRGFFKGGIFANVEWGTTGTEEEKEAYASHIQNAILDAPVVARYESQEVMRAELYSMNGGFLFLGIFLGTLFIIGTILITYFKQISEGYDDRERFQIMQKVGLDKEMIRDTSRGQVIWMFLLPLLVATIHTAFAYPIIQKLLLIFGVTSHVTLISCIAGVVVSFSVLYWLIYRLTARIYYSIVK